MFSGLAGSKLLRNYITGCLASRTKRKPISTFSFEKYVIDDSIEQIAEILFGFIPQILCETRYLIYILYEKPFFKSAWITQVYAFVKTSHGTLRISAFHYL